MEVEYVIGFKEPVHGTGEIRVPARDSVRPVSRTIGQGCLGCPGKAVRALSPTSPSALEVMANPCPDLNKIACQITFISRLRGQRVDGTTKRECEK